VSEPVGHKAAILPTCTLLHDPRRQAILRR